MCIKVNHVKQSTVRLVYSAVSYPYPPIAVSFRLQPDSFGKKVSVFKSIYRLNTLLETKENSETFIATKHVSTVTKQERFTLLVSNRVI